MKNIAVLAAPFVLLGATAAAALTLSPSPPAAVPGANASWLQACSLANHRT